MSKKDFYQALDMLQRDIPLITKGEEAFKYKYAPLEKIMDVIKPHLEAHNFVMRGISRSHPEHGVDVVGTQLIHLGSGHSEECTLTIIPGSDAQQTGSHQTYFRRYTTISILGIQPVGEDFDGLKSEALLKGAPVAPKGNGKMPKSDAIPKRAAPKKVEASPSLPDDDGAWDF